MKSSRTQPPWHQTTETYLGWRQRTNGGRIAVSLTTQQLHPDLYRIYIFLLDTAEWDTSKVVDMSETFYEASSFQGVGVSTWDVSSVTNMHDMHDMFGKGHSFNADLSAWDVRQVTSMAQMVRQRAMFKCCAASFNTCTYIYRYSYYPYFVCANSLRRVAKSNPTWKDGMSVVCSIWMRWYVLTIYHYNSTKRYWRNVKVTHTYTFIHQFVQPRSAILVLRSQCIRKWFVRLGR